MYCHLWLLECLQHVDFPGHVFYFALSVYTVYCLNLAFENVSELYSLLWLNAVSDTLLLARLMKEPLLLHCSLLIVGGKRTDHKKDLTTCSLRMCDN